MPHPILLAAVCFTAVALTGDDRLELRWNGAASPALQVANESAAGAEATARERFRLLYDSLTAITREYMNDTLKTIAFLLLAVGWIVTSERSREFLRWNRRARWAALCSVPLIAGLHIWWSIRAYTASQNKLALLRELDYMPADFYASDGITLFTGLLNLVIHLALFVTLFMLILALGRSGRPRGEPGTP